MAEGPLENERELDGVAIVGMSLRIPGAETLGEFWRNLVNAQEDISFFSVEELLEEGLPEELVRDPDFVRARGLFRNPEGFDAAFFGYTARDAELMDPQHRVFLEECWSALESAGYVPDTYQGMIGVWGGISTGMTNNTYLLSNLHGNPAASSPEDLLPTMLGNENDYLTTRVSYKMNLRGPSVNVQTACSTSLAAITMAYQSLMTYGCDMALAGGVAVSFPQKDGYVFQEGGIGSLDGHCRPFDAEGHGTVFSNGVGVVTLKRLEDALEDEDTIFAVIRGAAMNNDGAGKMSFAAPSVQGQADVISHAQAIADVSARDVTYVECHGTGTPIGDPIEVSALTRAFRETTDAVGFCALGSVKSNIGHLDSAAGVVGLIKTALALQNRTLPATVHFRRPNPNIDFATSPFFVSGETTAWVSESGPRRAGVSSFGIGGTNAHLVLEEAPERRVTQPSPERPMILPISGKTKEALEANLASLAGYLGEDDSAPLAHVAFTLQEGRKAFRWRTALVARDGDQAHSLLSPSKPLIMPRRKALTANRSVAYLLSGGGSQYVDMGRGLYDEIPLFRDAIDEGLSVFQDLEGVDLRGVWFPKEPEAESAAEKFQRPSLQLPAVYILQVALARLWDSWGIQPQALLGHSLGENTAAHLANVFSYRDGLGLVSLRGRLFEKVPPGGMLSVAASEEALAPFLTESLALAAINGPEQCTLSGPQGALADLAVKLEKEGVEFQRIPISIAAHSELVDPILPEFEAYLNQLELKPPSIPIVSNLTGTWLTDAEATSPGYWVRHLRNTVRFSQGVAQLLAAGERILLEVGPGKILGSLAKLQDPGISGQTISSIRHRDDETHDLDYFYWRAADLWANGKDISWDAGRAEGNNQRVPLPTYAFQRRRFFVEPDRGSIPLPPLTEHFSFGSMEDVGPLSAPAHSPQEEVLMVRSREEVILERLTGIIEEMSGLPGEEIDIRESFLDLGFDSLFLTQANLRFRKEFKVKITFRQLFDEAPCLDELARFIDGHLPEDALKEELEVRAPPSLPSAPLTATPMPSPSSLGFSMPDIQGASPELVQALVLQNQANAALLHALTPGGDAVPQASTAAPAPPAEKPSDQRDQKAKALGPYKPLERGSGGLDEAAKAALDQFCAAYSERTKQSKELAAAQRGVLSDARSISGFRRDWKEIVYQIAAGEGSKGSRVWDLDGNEYIDLTSGFGINLFGYSPEWSVEAARKQLDSGFELGTLSPLALEAAQLIHELTGMDRSTFTNTGSEALNASVRAARTTTGKDRIAVFYDEYHGIADEFLVNCLDTPKGRTTIPTSPGIPQFIVENVLVLKWDDDFLAMIEENADELAAVVIEPVQNRNPSLKTGHHFQAIRELTQKHDIALIFDEMITGFRLAPGGAQEYFGVEVDMACYGKIPSGGLPLAILSGRGSYLDCFDGGPWEFGDDSFPEAGVTFFGGTFTRHPLSLSTCAASLRHIKSLGRDAWGDLNAKSRAFAHRLNEILSSTGFPARIEHCESIFNLKFNDTNPFSRLIFWQLRHRGILIYDRPFFMSTAHTEEELGTVLQAFRDSIQFLQESGIAPPTELDGRAEGSRAVAFNESQTEVWMGTKFGEEASRAFHEQVIYDLEGPVDLPALRHAVQKVVQRHEGLRATVSPDSGSWIIHPAVHIPVTEVDLTTFAEEEGKMELRARVREDLVTDFHLTAGPLMRVTLFQMSEASFTLVISSHHIVIDGWSMGVVLNDLAEYYGAACRSESFGSASPDSLSAAVEEEVVYRESPEYEETEAFWVDQYRDSIPQPLDLPLDHPRPSWMTYNGERQSLQFDAELSRALTDFCAAQRCTVFTALYSAFSVLMADLTGQTDLVVGVAMAGQALSGQADLVGHSVNFLPFRTQVSLDQAFSDVLSDARDYIIEVNDHQRYTYASLLRHLTLPRTSDRHPLVSVSFNLDQGMGSFDFNGVEAQYRVGPRGYVKHDLFFNVVMEGEEISLEVDQNSDILEGTTVRGWMDRYLALLKQMVETPSKPIAELVSR